MNRVVRAFLVWVMVIAMPVQGMAASAMLFCGPSHESMMQGLVLGASAVAPMQTHGPDHGHAAAGHADASEDAAGTDADGAGGSSAHHGKFGCSACAACCSVLALPASFELPEAVSTAHPLLGSPAAPVASRSPGGLDRPPRTVLA